MAYTTINKSSEHFNTKLYTGNATDNTAITGVGFQPDFTWIKARSINYSHNAQDAVRGAGKRLEPDQTYAEGTYPSFKSFDTDGFTLGTSAGVNDNGQTFASWNWKAGTTGSGTTGQSKTYNYSVNTTAGFSIITYQGSGVTNHKIPHHLGAKPTVKIVKAIGHTENWACYWDVFQNSASYIQLNTDNGKLSNSGKWGGYDTNTTINLGTNDDTNKASSSVNFVAYCFAEKQGFSKIGSYTGNGNADGTFVYTGFKPAFVMAKRTDTTDNWLIKDIKRDPLNQMAKRIFPNLNNAEDTSGGGEFDFLSNGFKNRGTNTINNASGGSYIYMAFAEAPLVGTNGVTAKAR